MVNQNGSVFLSATKCEVLRPKHSNRLGTRNIDTPDTFQHCVTANLQSQASRHPHPRPASKRHTERGYQVIEAHCCMGIWRSQPRQALAKNLLTTFRIQTEELPNRKNQFGGTAFPWQIGQVALVSAMHLIRLLPAGGTSRLQRPCFHDPLNFVGVKSYVFNLQQVGSSENCLHPEIFSHLRQPLHQHPARAISLPRVRIGRMKAPRGINLDQPILAPLLRSYP